MNIFVTSKNPKECAEALDDLRLNKMILETAQILSTAVNECDPHNTLGLYKSTHKNHPCCVWARQARGNYVWLLEHFYELLIEKYRRTKKRHKSGEMAVRLSIGREAIPEGDMTPFANCTPHKDIANTYDAYRQTLNEKWMNDKRPPKWTKSNAPKWCVV